MFAAATGNTHKDTPFSTGNVNKKDGPAGRVQYLPRMVKVAERAKLATEFFARQE